MSTLSANSLDFINQLQQKGLGQKPSIEIILGICQGCNTKELICSQGYTTSAASTLSRYFRGLDDLGYIKTRQKGGGASGKGYSYSLTDKMTPQMIKELEGFYQSLTGSGTPASETVQAIEAAEPPLSPFRPISQSEVVKLSSQSPELEGEGLNTLMRDVREALTARGQSLDSLDSLQRKVNELQERLTRLEYSVSRIGMNPAVVPPYQPPYPLQQGAPYYEFPGTPRIICSDESQYRQHYPQPSTNGH